MKVTLLYTHNTPADRDIEYLKDQLERVKIPITLIDADSREGAALSELYDLLDRPALLVTHDDGSLERSWQGKLPPVSEVQSLYSSTP